MLDRMESLETESVLLYIQARVESFLNRETLDQEEKRETRVIEEPM